jgi:hypothetical protein
MLLLLCIVYIHSVKSSYFEIADSYKNFSSVQNFNGWNYGYYQNSNPRTNFNFYSTATSGTDTHPYSWQIQNSYCQINKDTFHPTTGTTGSCSTTASGKCRPSLLWNVQSQHLSYAPYQITLQSNAYGTCGDGVNVKLYVNSDTQDKIYNVTYTYSVGEYVFARKVGDSSGQKYKAQIIAINNGIYTVRFEDGSIESVDGTYLSIYYDCNCIPNNDDKYDVYAYPDATTTVACEILSGLPAVY